MQKITPFLWFDSQLEEAMKFYVDTFKNSRIGTVRRYGDAGPGPKGSVMTASFTLEGQEFHGLNGGPHFKFTPAISLFVDCKTQQEVDALWNKLSEGGRKDRCGWLQDRFGLSWQIVPDCLGPLLGDPDPAKANRVMQAMLQMDKLDIAKLVAAHGGPFPAKRVRAAAKSTRNPPAKKAAKKSKQQAKVKKPVAKKPSRK
jgi:predicted 3-demethylubiquinone-9 3-methyltransferase (glyoxalase superfamily)